MAKTDPLFRPASMQLVEMIRKLENRIGVLETSVGVFDISNEFTPAVLTTSQDDYVPGNYDILRLYATVDINITGITDGVKGRFLEILNVGPGRITFLDEDSGSVDINRISTPYDEPITCLRNARVTFYYDSTAERWSLSDAPSIQGLFGKSALVTHATSVIITPASGVETKITPNTVISDTWGYWDAVNFRFTIPAGENGIYIACITGAWLDGGAGGLLRELVVRLNGSLNVGALGVPNVATISTEMILTTLVRMNSGQYIEFYGTQSSGAPLSFLSHSTTAPVLFFSKLQ